MEEIRLERLCKTYPDGSPALVDVSLGVAQGELLVLVGPSGCGKTTALRIIAGLETPTSGRVFLGREVTTLPARARDVCLVSQRPALFPMKTVRENLALGDRLRHPGRLLGRRFRRLGALQRRQVEYEEMKENE